MNDLEIIDKLKEEIPELKINCIRDSTGKKRFSWTFEDFLLDTGDEFDSALDTFIDFTKQHIAVLGMNLENALNDLKNKEDFEP